MNKFLPITTDSSSFNEDSGEEIEKVFTTTRSNGATGRILTAVEDEGIKIPHFAKQLLDTIETGQKAFTSNLGEWITFAGNMENEDGSNQVGRRLQFMANNMANLHHNQFYGNRQPFRLTPSGKLDVDNSGNPTFLPPSDEELRASSVRFAAKQNLDYWEERVGSYIKEAQTNGLSEQEYSEDFNYQAIVVREAEARMWFNVLQAFSYWTDVLEQITGEMYVYAPYGERRSSVAKQSNVTALAASLKKS